MAKISFKKSDIFASIAFVLMVVFFTIPMIAYHGTPEKIKSGNGDKVPDYICALWNIYQTGRYVSPYTPKGAEKDLRQMIERKGEIGVMSTPVWFVSLEAPNYPKEAFPNGIPVYFHLDGYSGDVHEMNTINHFIGMYPMDYGGQLEFAISPYLVLGMSLLFILFIVYKNKISQLFLVPATLFPFGFFAIYAGWLYWYGHNMQDWGMFKVKPFMPTALGDGRVAQFTTHSYPTIGFYVLLIIAILSVLAILARRKELK